MWINLITIELPSRIKIDLDDGNGNKIAISFIGKITRDKVIKILDFVELINGTYLNKIGKESNEELSKFDKIQEIVKRKFPIGWFTSQEIMISYEDTFEEPIGLSTVSTYL